MTQITATAPPAEIFPGDAIEEISNRSSRRIHYQIMEEKEAEKAEIQAVLKKALQSTAINVDIDAPVDSSPETTSEEIKERYLQRIRDMETTEDEAERAEIQAVLKKALQGVTTNVAATPSKPGPVTAGHPIADKNSTCNAAATLSSADRVTHSTVASFLGLSSSRWANVGP
jgi:hypothetical protein